MKPDISVIIPIYNAEIFLVKCIESILSQTFDNFELILVNDGSTDNSLSICRSYQVKDNRIYIVDQINSGVSSARNIGIERSNAKYIIFIDADDYTDKTMLEDLHSKAVYEAADITFCDFYYNKYNIDRIINVNFIPNTYTSIERILTGHLQGFMCNKFIKRSLYIDNDIRFNTSITMGEDMLVMCQLLLHAKTLSYVPKPYFHYVQHKNSAVGKRAYHSFESQKMLVNIFQELLINNTELSAHISMYKIFVKKEMLLYGNFTYDEIRETYPDVNSKISSYTAMNRFEKAYFSAVINKSKNTIINKYIYLISKKLYSTRLAWIIKSKI